MSLEVAGVRIPDSAIASAATEFVRDCENKRKWPL